jgi:group II intron reverse transcriptase/maturase
LEKKDSQIITKPIEISKKLIVAAWERVRKNAGSYGVDKLTIDEIQENLKDHLYKLWNRMSSGSYMASPVRKVEIPKADGKTRTLGIPTVLDRVAQMAAVLLIEGKIDSQFHESSYGYRPGRSALQGIAKAREECFHKPYVVDLDIKGFFDNIPHDKMMEMVEKYVDVAWVRLYISRWLKSEMEDSKGTRTARDKGTPQGGVISPLLANLYLHEVFDTWMVREFGGITFERYADDVIIHCVSHRQAQFVLKKVRERMKAFGLELHPDKTKIVYCWHDGRERKEEAGVGDKFDFLGYTFRTRSYKSPKTGKMKNVFTPAVSEKAKKKIKSAIRDLKISKYTSLEIEEIAGQLNPKLQGWNTYYGKFRKWDLYDLFRDIDRKIVKWYGKKYKVGSVRAGWKWLEDFKSSKPKTFAHWVFMTAQPACVKGRAV